MLLTAHQPQYFGWMGFWAKIAAADEYVVLDDVDFSKGDTVNRCKIRTPEGWQWLTIPVSGSGKIRDIRASEGWQSKHLKAIEQRYSKARYTCPVVLPDLGEYSWWAATRLHIHHRPVFQSELDVVGEKNELLINICRARNADAFLFGGNGRSYVDVDMWKKAGIKPLFQEYTHPTYTQVYPGFELYMGILDLLLCHGPYAREVLDAGHHTSEIPF